MDGTAGDHEIPEKDEREIRTRPGRAPDVIQICSAPGTMSVPVLGRALVAAASSYVGHGSALGRMAEAEVFESF